MSHFTAQPANNAMSKIINHRGKHVAWVRRIKRHNWHLFDLDWRTIPCTHVASPDHGAIIYQSL